MWAIAELLVAFDSRFKLRNAFFVAWSGFARRDLYYFAVQENNVRASVAPHVANA